MIPGPVPGAVVVAVDEAGTAADAVDWASAEAATRRCPLRIVHAVRIAMPVPYGMVAAPDDLLVARSTSETLLRRSAARARSVASEIEITTCAIPGTPARVLLAESADARVLVTGSRSRRGLRGRLTRSVSGHAAAHARCPVVVIRPRSTGVEPGWSPPRVVVGVDAARPSAVEFAFRAARQRGLPLFFVRAWTPDPPADLEGVSGGGVQTERLARRALQRAVESHAREFPDVPVHTALVRADPAQALVTHSDGAALLVIGTRGRRRLRPTTFGTLGHDVVQHGHCPVAIVPDGPAAPAPSGPPESRRPGRGSPEGRRTPRGRRPASGPR